MATPGTITLPSVPGVIPALQAAGITTWVQDGVQWVSDTVSAASVIAGYNPILYVTAQQLAAAKNAKYATIFGGYTSTVTGSSIPCQTDTTSLQWLESLYSAAGRNPSSTFNFKDRNNVYHALTSSQMQALANDVSQWVQQSVATEMALIAQINATGLTWQQIQAIQITGFPANS